MRKQQFFALLFFIMHFKALSEQQDSLSGISLDMLYKVIIKNHPVVKQAGLLTEQAKQELLFARGFFEPKIEVSFDEKNFQDKDYYNLWNNVLKVPVWFNTDLKLGFEQNSGQYLNDENRMPEDGLIYGGISVPIGQGLIIDKRRTVLRQAQLMTEIANAEKIKLINKILLQATKDYWNWYLAYHNLRLYEEAVNLADTRYRAIKNNIDLGEYAPIDSVEAKIILQNRNIERRQALLAFQNTGLILSNHLWSDDAIPLQLSENAFPTIKEDLLLEDFSQQEIDELLLLAENNHPELIKLEIKQKQLELEQRLNRENLKPVLNLNYNFLNSAGSQVNRNGQFFTNDYKLGVEFAFPVFLRKERAKLEQTNLKLIDNNLEQLQTQREIINLVITSYNDILNLNNILEMQQEMVNNYQRLLSAELLNFQTGESSLFLVNTRETKLIEARAKLLELQVKYQKAKINLLWAAGVPNLTY